MISSDAGSEKGWFSENQDGSVWPCGLMIGRRSTCEKSRRAIERSVSSGGNNRSGCSVNFGTFAPRAARAVAYFVRCLSYYQHVKKRARHASEKMQMSFINCAATRIRRRRGETELLNFAARCPAGQRHKISDHYRRAKVWAQVKRQSQFNWLRRTGCRLDPQNLQ